MDIIKFILIMLFKMEELFWLINGNGILVNGSKLIFVLMFLKIWNKIIMIIFVVM